MTKSAAHNSTSGTARAPGRPAQVCGTTTTVTHDPPDTLQAEDQWGRRRGNVRHEVAIAAVITDRKQTPIKCTIEDVSSTGMSLRLEMRTPEPGREPLPQGTEAKIEFAPDPEDAPADKITVPVQVMWRTPVGAGIRFLRVSEQLRSALRSIAQAAVQSRADSPERVRDTEAHQRKIMLACRKTLEKLLPNLIWALRTETSKRLRTMADTAPPAAAKEARAEADLIDEKANAIGRTIERQFMQSFVQTSDLEQTQELVLAPLILKKTAAKTEGPTVKIVAEQAAEQNATLVAIAHAAEERYKLKLFELNVRVANVIGHPLDNKSSPLVPTNACRILWQATVDYCDSPRVRRALQEAMRARVVPLLGELYEALDKTLDQEGVERAFNRLGS